MALTLAQLIASGVAGAQTKRDLPQFDAVSIKPTPAGDDKTLVQIFPDGISFHGAPIRMVLRTAFGIDDKHRIGSPAWTNATRYNIEAKVSPEDAQRFNKLKGAERNAMLVSVLAERFNLKFHHETRELPIYALVVAKGGPKLTRGAPDDPGRPKFPDPHKPEDLSKEHHWVFTIPGRIEADSITMYVLADQLTQLNAVGRPVVDKTGITGNYNFTLRWTADNLPFPILHEVGGLDAATAKDENTPSSLFTAIQEQLGLKLEPQKDHSDVTVIDHIDPPSPN
jgi:bla regulator protein blaR1